MESVLPGDPGTAATLTGILDRLERGGWLLTGFLRRTADAARTAAGRLTAS